MIFITVGTTPFPFARMVKMYDEICQKRKNKELVIFQYGASGSVEQRPNVILYRELPFFMVKKIMKEARLIICHGGPATIFLALQSGTIPIVIPREKKFGEHVDDHQRYFFEFMVKKGRVEPATNIYRFLKTEAVSKALSYSTKKIVTYFNRVY